MKTEYIVFKGKRYCNVYIDKSTVNGCLRCSHEISITFAEENGAWKFNGAWHCGVFDEDSFEQTFPGLLEEVRKEMENNEVA